MVKNLSPREDIEILGEKLEMLHALKAYCAVEARKRPEGTVTTPSERENLVFEAFDAQAKFLQAAAKEESND